MKERLKQLRKELGLKQREIAERLGIGVGLVGRWEAGLQPIPKTRIYQLCKEYNVRPEWFETGEGEMFEAEENKFVKMFRTLYESLSPEGKEAFVRVANEFGVLDDPDGQDYYDD